MRTKYQTNKMTPYLWSIFQLLKWETPIRKTTVDIRMKAE